MASNHRPNILIILSDQHNASFMGCAGNAVLRTPHLDRMAAEGLRFTHAYCAAPLCVPSRMSFMTARRPSGNRVWSNGHILSSAIPTWAHALGAAGYETALLGRMHFVGPDQRHGFECRPIGEYSARHPGTPEAGGPRWTQFSGASCGQSRACVEIAGHGTTSYQYFDDRVMEYTCSFLRRKARQKGRRPFAAVAGFVLPHCPFIAPKELFEYYRERIDVPLLTEEETARQPATIRRFRQRRGILDPLPEPAVRHARAAYFGLCEYLDRHVGRILDCLDETSLSKDTLLIYVSDHGEMAGEHGCWWKSSYHEGSAGVPMLARWPGVVPAGGTCAAICNLMDIGPTALEAAGAEPMKHVHGRSLWAWMRGQQPADWPDETFCEFHGKGGDPPSCMIRSGKWKLWTYHGEPPPALFDLERDPGEQTDLGLSPQHAEVRERLLARIGEVWDPERVARECQEQLDNHAALAAWGKAVRPAHEDTLPAPPPEIEADVELL